MTRVCVSQEVSCLSRVDMFSVSGVQHRMRRKGSDGCRPLRSVACRAGEGQVALASRDLHPARPLQREVLLNLSFAFESFHAVGGLTLKHTMYARSLQHNGPPFHRSGSDIIPETGTATVVLHWL